MLLKNGIDYIKRLVRKIIDDDMLLRASGVSFYILLAFFPFIIILFLMASRISSNISNGVLKALELLPADINGIIQQLITNIDSGSAVIATMLGVSLWTLSGALVNVSKSMNVFYGVRKKRNFVVNRLMAIGWAAMMLMMIVAVMLLIVFGDIVRELVYTKLHITPHSTLRQIVWVMTLVATEIGILAMIYKSVIVVKVRFLSVVKGAAVSVMLWLISSYAFGIYVSNFARYHILYGSIAGIVILVIWIYITSMVILLGGEINAMNYEKNNLNKLQ
jgi:membrane protein